MGRIKLKHLAEGVAEGGLIVATGGAGAGAVALIEAKKQKKKVESTTYTIDRFVADEKDPNQVNIHYSPSLALAKSDTVTISGTPFDGTYKPKRSRTRNDVYIQLSSPVPESGTSGTFRVKTSIGARMKGGVRATEAGVRTGAKKTGSIIGKGIGFFWNKIKKFLLYGFLFILAIFLIYKVSTAYLVSKATAQPQYPPPQV
jgi:hypothetical protein